MVEIIRMINAQIHYWTIPYQSVVYQLLMCVIVCYITVGLSFFTVCPFTKTNV